MLLQDAQCSNMYFVYFFWFAYFVVVWSILNDPADE